MDETVVLTCNNPDDDGNPDCNVYTWNKIEDSDRIVFNETKTLKFEMEESRAGNYTCTCHNGFGSSTTSNVAEVIFLSSPATGSRVFTTSNFAKSSRTYKSKIELKHLALLSHLFMIHWFG